MAFDFEKYQSHPNPTISLSQLQPVKSTSEVNFGFVPSVSLGMPFHHITRTLQTPIYLQNYYQSIPRLNTL